MNPGYVYILVNDAMPGLVKIGRTERDVELRASELWQTGVPTKFEVYAAEKTFNCVELERFLHVDLAKHRISKSREFFRVDPEEARERLLLCAEIQWNMFLSENSSSMSVVPLRSSVSVDAVEKLAKAMGQSQRVIADALSLVTPEELAPALRRAIAEFYSYWGDDADV